ncbi:MAG: phosphoribosylformylglycinamidine synthase subunit PurS, partial [Desulfobacterales bacterium]|nr:phosphoribosylformylglycinamidine synthase subunit PurS [Desulfobacterales bacterium]
MAHRLEITLKNDLFDPEGEGVRRKAADYFHLALDRVRTIQVLTIDAALSHDQCERIRTEIFTNPVTQVSSFAPLPEPFDWVVWVGLRPGVRDNPGATAAEAIEDGLGIRLPPEAAVYTSKRYCIQ